MNPYAKYRDSVKTATTENGVPSYVMNDGLTIPGIAFGTFELPSDSTAERCVADALEIGYRHFDCAAMYYNEQEVGSALAASGIPRNELFITSKVWIDAIRQDRVRESCQRSIEKLQSDYLDLFLIHWPVAGHYQKAWETMHELRQEGLVKSIGVCNCRPKQIAEMVKGGLSMPAVDQMEHHVKMQDMETVDFCADNEVLYEAWSPLGRASLWGHEELHAVAKTANVTISELVIAWDVLNHVIPLPRSTSKDHMEENFKACSIKLPEDVMNVVSELNELTPLMPNVTPEEFSLLDKFTTMDK